MVILRNLKRIGDLIEADYYTANIDDPGHIVVDVAAKKTVDYTLIPGGGSCRSDLHYAEWFIITYLFDKYDFSDEYVVEWY